MIFSNKQTSVRQFRWAPALFFILFSGTAATSETRYDIGGRLSAEGIYATYPDDSVAGEVAGSSTLDTNGAVFIPDADRSTMPCTLFS